MGPTDFIIIAAIVALLALAVRSIARGGAGGCSDCGSRGTCTARATGGRCSAADDMLRRAESALGKRD